MTNKTNQIRAKFNKRGNIKLGHKMWTFSKLYGAKKYATKYGKIEGTCGHHCAGCEGACYVKSSYRYPSVVDGHARNTLAFRNDLTQAFSDLQNQIDRARNKPELIRIDQSGEIESPIELLNWVLMAKRNPAQKFYTYTKNFEALRMVIHTFEDGATMPQNITINISIWHEYGLKEYLEEFKQFSFIKAFVYDDRAFNYAAHGLTIGTYCAAYDEHGNMNHAITCELCRKCIDRKCAVIGCYDH